MFVQFPHHGKLTWSREDLRGTHRAHCLCYNCAGFKPGTALNCPIAQMLFQFDVEHEVVTPVYECAQFIPTSETQS
jgi:hypothetical protein